MRSIGPSSEEEMVLAFLKAEIDSAEYREVIEGALSKQGYTRAIVDDANLQNPRENHARAVCLSCSRGYRLNDGLFRGFPNEVVWQRVSLSSEELGQTKYINQSVWVTGSGGTRFVSDGAKNLDAGTLLDSLKAKIRAIEASVRAGCRPPELILVGKGDDSALVLVEGHSRATAYVRAASCLTEGVEAIVGLAADMDGWHWY
jgi:hypothetical protein